MAKILVVDDDPSISEMLTIVLEAEGFAAVPVRDGLSALPAYEREKPDLILLDLMLPGMNGVDVCRAIRQKSDVPIIMLTAKTDTVDIVLGLESGADDYVTKPFKAKELVARIRARLRHNDAPQQDHRLKIGDLVIDPEAHAVTRGGEEIALTPIEFDILHTLASEPRKAFTHEELRAAVWGDSKASERVVRVHVQRLRAKIEKDPDNPTLILTVRGVGYKTGAQA